MMLVGPVQVRPISIITIAAVQAAAAGKDVPRKSHPKTVSMESRIANGCSIKTKLFTKLSGTSKYKVFSSHPNFLLYNSHVKIENFT